MVMKVCYLSRHQQGQTCEKYGKGRYEVYIPLLVSERVVVEPASDCVLGGWAALLLAMVGL